MVRKCLRGVWGLVLWFFGDDNPRHNSPRQYQIVEVEKLLPGGSEDAIPSLKDHPGFIALLNKLRMKQAFLRAQLNNRQESLRDVDILVSGLAWARFMEFELNAAVGRAQKTPALASVDEIETFEKIRQAIADVGSQDQN